MTNPCHLPRTPSGSKTGENGQCFSDRQTRLRNNALKWLSEAHHYLYVESDLESLNIVVSGTENGKLLEYTEYMFSVGKENRESFGDLGPSPFKKRQRTLFQLVSPARYLGMELQFNMEPSASCLI